MPGDHPEGLLQPLAFSPTRPHPRAGRGSFTLRACPTPPWWRQTSPASLSWRRPRWGGEAGGAPGPWVQSMHTANVVDLQAMPGAAMPLPPWWRRPHASCAPLLLPPHCCWAGPEAGGRQHLHPCHPLAHSVSQPGQPGGGGRWHFVACPQGVQGAAQCAVAARSTRARFASTPRTTSGDPLAPVARRATCPPAPPTPTPTSHPLP